MTLNEKVVGIARAACELLKRTDVKGHEVPGYVNVFNWLQEFIDGDSVCITKEEFQNYNRWMDEYRALASAVTNSKTITDVRATYKAQVKGRGDLLTPEEAELAEEVKKEEEA